MAVIYLDRPVQEGDPIGSVYDSTRTQTKPLTMDQLNEAYKKMSIYGDTYGDIVAPMPVDNASGINNIPSGINNIPSGIELTAPINNIQPYIPVTNQGDGQGNNNNIFKSYSLYNDEFDPNNKRYMENKTGIAGILEFLQKISPTAMLYRAGKTGIENIQKHFADKKENQRLADLVQQRSIHNIQRGLDDDPRGTGKGISSMLETQYSVHANENQANNAAAQAAQAAINERAARTRESFRGNQGGGGGAAPGTGSSGPPGRNYNKGGIVTL